MSPKWLDILKASGWKTGAISVASALLLYFNEKKLLPVPLDLRVIEGAEVTLILCGCLSIFSILSGVVEATKPVRLRLRQHWAIRKAKHDIEAAIPQMTGKEREILGYLVGKNQRHFTSDLDGGYANTLISKGFVRDARLPGQICSSGDVPFEVPRHVWEVLNKHKEALQYTYQNGQPHPWRVSAWAR